MPVAGVVLEHFFYSATCRFICTAHFVTPSGGKSVKPHVFKDI